MRAKDVDTIPSAQPESATQSESRAGLTVHSGAGDRWTVEWNVIYCARVAGQSTPATALLTRQKVRFTLHTYEVSADAPNYGLLVAQSLGVAAERVFKTLITEVDGALTVAVVPVIGDVE